MRLPQHYKILFFGSIFLALLAMVLVHISTPAGAGLANDSAAYIGGARSILAGTGYSDVWLDSSLEPITHYPPLLSILLSTIGFFGIDPLRSIRILDIFFFGINTILITLLAYKATRNNWLALWAGALFVFSPALLRVSLFAMSEPLFLVLSLFSLFLFYTSVEKQWGVKWLVFSGISAALAILTRYSGLALLPVAVILIVLENAPWQQKAKRLTVYVLPVGLLVGAWLLRNRITAGNITNRVLEYHPIDLDQIASGAYNISRMLLPYEPLRQAAIRAGIWNGIVTVIIVLAYIGLGVLVTKVLRKRYITEKDLIPSSFLLYQFSYFSLIFFSITFFDHSTRLIDRILAPGVIILILMAATLLKQIYEWGERSIQKYWAASSRIFILVLAGAALTVSFIGQTEAVAKYDSEGQGYASWRWHDSEILKMVKDMPTDIAIYTNTPPAVYLVTGRASRVMPAEVDPVNGNTRQNFPDEMAQMRADILAGKAVLALFNTSDIESSQDQMSLSGTLSTLPILKKTGDATLFGVSLR